MAAELEVDTGLSRPHADVGPRRAEDPHWLRELLALPLVEKARLMGAALWFFVRAPHRFGQTWVAGGSSIPNPVIAMAASASLLALALQEVGRRLKKDVVAHSLVSSVAETLAPY